MAADSPQELGSATATMPMEGSGMASMATDAPGSAARGSRDAWAGYVPSAQASGQATGFQGSWQASGQARGFQGSGQASASSLAHFQESMQQANALHEPLDHAQQHVNTWAQALNALRDHKTDHVWCICVCGSVCSCIAASSLKYPIFMLTLIFSLI